MFRNSSLLTALAAILLVGAGFAIWRAVPRTPPAPEGIKLWPRAQAYVFGRAIAAAIPEGGEVVLLGLQDLQVPGLPRRWEQEITRNYQAGLEEGLGKGFRVHVTGPEKADAGDFPLFPASSFDRWIHSQPAPVAVVSFVGLPRDATPELFLSWPPFYCARYSEYDHWQPWLEQGYLQGVISNKTVAVRPNQLPPRQSLQEIFDAAFILVQPPGTN